VIVPIKTGLNHRRSVEKGKNTHRIKWRGTKKVTKCRERKKAVKENRCQKSV